MTLAISTFDNKRGGNPFFKAAGHPLAARAMPALLAELAAAGPVAIYDPLDCAEDLAALYDLTGLTIEGVYVQDLDHLGGSKLGQAPRPVTDLAGAKAATVWLLCFDDERPRGHIAHLVPAGAKVQSLAPLRLPEEMLSDTRNYLANVNFATNFAFFREAEGQHSRVATADYWSGYGAKAPFLWLCLFDESGAVLAEWRETWDSPGGAIAIDSGEVRRRFGLGAFTGQLFLHACGIAGHDIVKYALDTYGDDAQVLSCTHDANAWPADYYAGLPAPRADETVLLWVQNSHPAPIPGGAVGLNPMGRDEAVAWLQDPLPAFASTAVDTRSLLPETAWPQQIEVVAGKHMVRPRYEVLNGKGRSRIAHVNVERADLKPDPRIADIANLMGKGYILAAPLLPPARYRTSLLPTPMARAQANLPLAVLVYDAEGREVATRSLGTLPRDHETALDLADLLDGNTELRAAPNGGSGPWGHVELVYDFSEGGEADGWLHAIFRYEDLRSGHSAETSFGSHIFNTVLTYKSEPQSYAGRPPGLSTRLFLRLGPPPLEAFCHLIYPASTPWHANSETHLALHGADGREIASREVAIPCGGSLLWRVSETFDAGALEAAAGGYVIIRDMSCRLFGYHGLLSGQEAFSLDHMFGF